MQSWHAWLHFEIKSSQSYGLGGAELI